MDIDSDCHIDDADHGDSAGIRIDDFYHCSGCWYRHSMSSTISSSDNTSEFSCIKAKCDNVALKKEIERLNQQKLEMIDYYAKYIEKLQQKQESQIVELEKKHETIKLKRKHDKTVFDANIKEKDETIVCLQSTVNTLEKELGCCFVAGDGCSIGNIVSIHNSVMWIKWMWWQWWHWWRWPGDSGDRNDACARLITDDTFGQLFFCFFLFVAQTGVYTLQY